MLQFKVDGQVITRVDDIPVVADSRNYLYAKFDLSSDWDDVDVIAQFTAKCAGAKAVRLDDDNTCLVPWEVLQGSGVVLVTVYGGDLITANNAAVFVEESGYGDEAPPACLRRPRRRRNAQRPPQIEQRKPPIGRKRQAAEAEPVHTQR